MSSLEAKEGIVLGPDSEANPQANSQANGSAQTDQPLRAFPFKVFQLKGPVAAAALLALPLGIVLMMTFGLVFIVGLFATSLLGSLGVGIARGLGLPDRGSKKIRRSR